VSGKRIAEGEEEKDKSSLPRVILAKQGPRILIDLMIFLKMGNGFNLLDPGLARVPRDRDDNIFSDFGFRLSVYGFLLSRFCLFYSVTTRIDS